MKKNLFQAICIKTSVLMLSCASSVMASTSSLTVSGETNIVSSSDTTLIGQQKIPTWTSITLNEGAHLNAGDQYSLTKIILNKSSKLDGTVYAGANISLKDSASINGNVSSGTHIHLQSNASITGDATASDYIYFEDKSSYNDGTATAPIFYHKSNASVIFNDATLIGKYQFNGNGNIYMRNTNIGQIDATTVGTSNIYVSGASTATDDWGMLNPISLVDVTDSLDMGQNYLYASKVVVHEDANLFVGQDTILDVTLAEDAALYSNGTIVTLDKVTLLGDVILGFKASNGVEFGLFDFQSPPINVDDHKISFVAISADSNIFGMTIDASGAVTGVDVSSMYAQGTDLTKIPVVLDPRTAHLTSGEAAAYNNVHSVALGAVHNTTTSAHYSIHSHITPADLGGVAAGDDVNSYGAWVSAIGNSATQRTTTNTPVGHKAKTFGSIVGFDAEIAEGRMVGIAATYAKGSMKLRDSKPGDKVNTDTVMGHVYAQQHFANNVFLQEILSYAQTNVKSKSPRITGATTSSDLSSSKYKVKGYAATLLGGYGMSVSHNMRFTPMLGMKFGKLTQGNITETGSSQNLAISVKHKNKITGVLGARIAANFKQPDMMLTPEAHAFLDYNLGSKKAATHKVSLDHQVNKVSQTVEHASRYAVNLGASVTAKSGRVEYSVGYDVTIAKKYVGHQGTLKVRMNL